MSAFEQRAKRLAVLVAEHELDLLLVSNLVNVRYMTGFGGTNGACLVGGRRRVFVTDFRYTERAKREVPDYDRVRGREDLLETVSELARDSRDGSEGASVRLGFDDASVTVRAHAKLTAHLGEGVELVPAAGLVEQLRAVKDAAEVAAIGRAAQLGDDVYRWLVSDFGLVGHTEREVAVALEQRARDTGADGVSFPPIVAAADNGALPHAESRRDAQIPRDTLVVVDFGVVRDAYCSDCTRTFATGDIDGEARECYELVRATQEVALSAVRPGAEVREVDRAARERIAQAGRGEQFGHGLGHGVGLEIHEAPRMAPTASGHLEVGNVVTVEPGVYVPGRFGVRIEDLAMVAADGPQVLTSFPKELIMV
jgi:Xaa-Pro aminopeptidase